MVMLVPKVSPSGPFAGTVLAFDGNTFADKALADADKNAAAANRTLTLYGTIPLKTAFTFTSKVDLRSVVLVPNGTNITLANDFIVSPERQAFDLTSIPGSSLTLSGLAKSVQLYPELFGTDPSGAIECAAQFQAYLTTMFGSQGHGFRKYLCNTGAKYLINTRLLWQLQNKDDVDFPAWFTTTADFAGALIDFNPAATPGLWNESTAAQVARCGATVVLDANVYIKKIEFLGAAPATQLRACSFLNGRFCSVHIGETENCFTGFEFAGGDSWEVQVEGRFNSESNITPLDWAPQIAGTVSVAAGSTALVGDANTDFTVLAALGHLTQRFGDDPRYYTIGAVADAHNATLTEGYGVLRGTVTSDGTVNLVGVGTDFKNLAPGDEILVGIDPVVYVVDTITNELAMSTTVAVPLQAGVRFFRNVNQAGVAAFESANGASIIAATTQLRHCYHLGGKSRFHIKWLGYIDNVRLTDCNGAVCPSVASIYFSNAARPGVSNPNAITIENYYHEQTVPGDRVIWFNDVQGSAAKAFTGVTIIGGHLGNADALGITAEGIGVNNIGAGLRIEGGEMPGTSMRIDAFCKLLTIGPTCYIPAGAVIDYTCLRARIVVEPRSRAYYGAGTRSQGTTGFLVPGFVAGVNTFSTGNQTLQMTDILPTHFRPGAGGLMPIAYLFELGASDTASAAAVGARVSATFSAANFAGAPYEAPTVWLGQVTNNIRRVQTIKVPAADDGSIYLDWVASGVNTLSISLALIGYEM